MWFPLGFHTWKQSTWRFHLDSLHWKLGGNLTSGFHEFPQLETINPIIPPHFLASEISGKPHKRFPWVSTQVNSQLRSIAWKINGYLRYFSHASTMFSKRYFQSIYLLLRWWKWQLNFPYLYLHKDVWLTDFFFEK